MSRVRLGSFSRRKVGCEYTPERWVRLLAFLKVAEWLGLDELPKRTLRRPWRSPRPRPVPESVLQPPHAAGESDRFLNVAGISEGEFAYVELVLDIKHLLGKGKTNAAIKEELELSSPHADEVIDFLREREQELL
jgi:hypothetical protein